MANVSARMSISEPALRAFFHWKYSGVLIPVFLSGDLSMISIGQGLDPSGASFNLVFELAYLFLIATLIWSLGYWLTSDFLRKRNPEFWSNKRKKREGTSATRKYHWLQRGASALVFLFFAGFVFLTALIREEKELSSLHGTLIPANDPLPPNPCPRVPENALLIYMGFATSWVTQFPHTIIEVDETPRLVVDRNQDSSIAISLEILGADGKVIAELNKNEFAVSPHSYFRMERKDRSSLVVFDDFKNEVLNVRYLNPKAIWINAELKYPGSNPVVFRGPGGGGICTGASGRAEIGFGTKK